jgi:hypothetical protein
VPVAACRRQPARGTSARNRAGSLESAAQWLPRGCRLQSLASWLPQCSRSHLEASRDSGYAWASARQKSLSRRRQEPMAAGRASGCPVRPSHSRGRADNIAGPGPSETSKKDPLNPVWPS